MLHEVESKENGKCVEVDGSDEDDHSFFDVREDVMISRTGLVEESDMKVVLEMRDDVHGRRPEDTRELEVFGGIEDDFATSETISDGLDDEVPVDKDKEDQTGRPMITVEVSS